MQAKAHGFEQTEQSLCADGGEDKEERATEADGQVDRGARSVQDGLRQVLEGERGSFSIITLLAQSHKKFFMRKDEVIQDAEYAMAKASSIMKGKKQNEIIDKSQQEQKKIDNQIEQLQKKLQEENKK